MNAVDRRVIGSAVQIGLMALDRHFDSWMCGDLPMGPWHYPPDWAATSIQPSGDRCYPWHVEGINLNVPPGEYGHRFSWTVSRLGWRFRFELCAHPVLGSDG